MDIEIDIAEVKDKEKLGDLIVEYQKELLNTEKVTQYKYLFSYWEDPNRYPFFIKLDNNIVGFALVNSYTVLEPGAKSISEFYIKKEFRNKGIGKFVAVNILNRYPGKWEIRELRENISAQKFWRKVIKEYTNNMFNEYDIKNSKWDGIVQTFNNSKLS